MFPGSEEEFFLIPDEIVERILVIGGGIAGLQAAQDLADMGYETVLLEREASLGGNMARLESMFPTLEHAVCSLRAKMQEIIAYPGIKALTYSEIESLSGLGGDFEATIRKKARYVTDSCNGCGLCWRACPVEVRSEFNLGMGTRKAIFLPFPQATPAIPTIDLQNCLHHDQGCEACLRACPIGCIDFEQQDELTTERFGTVIVATGFKPFDPSGLDALGFGRYSDVITSVQMERMLSGAGPTRGEVQRPSDKKRPKSVLFVSCVGSRDAGIGRPYCSRVCCGTIAKQAISLARLYGDIAVSVLYSDIQTTGREGEALIGRAREEYETSYVRGNVKQITQQGQELVATGEKLDGGGKFEIRAELIVLAVGVDPGGGSEMLSDTLGIMCDSYGFVSQADPKLMPLETTVPGIFVAGAASGPLDITESVVQGSGAAMKGIAYLNKLKRRQATISHTL